MERLTFYRSDPSRFAEARLCFQVPEGPRATPENPANRDLEGVHKEMMAIVTPLLAPGATVTVNMGGLRTAIQAADKSSSDPLALQRLLEMRQQISKVFGADSAVLKAFASGSAVQLTREQQIQFGRIATSIAPSGAVIPPEFQLIAEGPSDEERVQKALASLQDLKKEFAATEALRKNSKQNFEKLKLQIEREQQVVQRLLANIDQRALERLGQQIGVPDLAKRLPEILRSSEAQEARTQLLDVLNKISSGNNIDFYTGDEGILKISRTIIQSEGVQKIFAGLAEKGINIPQDKVLELLFGALRGYISDFLATSKLFSGSINMQQRGRASRYRIEVERAYLAHLQRNGAIAPGLDELLALSMTQMEETILRPNTKEIKDRWNQLYDSWQLVGQTARRGSMFGSIPPAPTIEHARTEESGKKYLAFINAAQKQQAEKTANTPRMIGGLDFNLNGANGTVAVDTTERIITHNLKPVKFQKNSNNSFTVKMETNPEQVRTIKFYNNGDQDPDSLKLVAPAAPSDVTGEVEVVASKGGVDKKVRLSQLTDTIRNHPNKTKIVIRETNDPRAE